MPHQGLPELQLGISVIPLGATLLYLLESDGMVGSNWCLPIHLSISHELLKAFCHDGFDGWLDGLHDRQVTTHKWVNLELLIE